MGALLMLNMDITKRCNLRCKHCGAVAGCHTRKVVGDKDGQSEMTFDEVDYLLLEAAQLGCHDVILAGGEAFFHPDLFRIIRRIAELGMHCAILTNGTLIDDEVACELSELGGLSFIRVSIDYANPARLDEHRGGKAILETIVEGIKKLKTVGLAVGIGMAVFPDNITEIKSVIELGNKLKVDFVRAVPVTIRGRTRDCQVDESFWASSLRGLVDALCDVGVKLSPDFAPLSNIKEISRLFAHHCPAGILSCSVAADGLAKPCALMPADSGEVYSWRDRPLKEIWCTMRESRIARYQERNFFGGRCAHCEWLSFCLGGCETEKRNRQINLAGDQPVCLPALVEQVFGNRMDDPKIRCLLSGIVSRQSTNLSFGINPCIRSSPLWLHPFVRD